MNAARTLDGYEGLIKSETTTQNERRRLETSEKKVTSGSTVQTGSAENQEKSQPIGLLVFCGSITETDVEQWNRDNFINGEAKETIYKAETASFMAVSLAYRPL
jgi:hypothetical protein